MERLKQNNMEELELRKQIIEICHYLQERNLVARTWGNVSARLDDEYFLITPSGLSYDLTTPEDLVKVKIKDCSYDKTQRKPSSEKLIHSKAYELRKDVNFVVHTHQFYASAICAEEFSVTLGDTFVPCADYGLPGTKALANNVKNVYIKFPECNIFLMAKHGTICLGSSKDEALLNAEYLETECKKLFVKRVPEFYVPEKMDAYLDDYAQMFPALDNEDQDAIKMVKEKNAAAALYAKDGKPMNKFDVKLQRFVYTKKYSKLKDKQ